MASWRYNILSIFFTVSQSFKLPDHHEQIFFTKNQYKKWRTPTLTDGIIHRLESLQAFRHQEISEMLEKK